MSNSFTFNDGVQVATAQTAVGIYHSSVDISNVFGANNVNKWADLDNSGDVAEIYNRLLAVIKYTESYINSKLNRSRYVIPFVTPVPLEIVEICSYISGSKLYEPRSTEDFDQDGGPAPMKTFTMAKRKVAENGLRYILAGRLILTVPPGNICGNEAPQWVKVDELRARPIPNGEISLDRLAEIALDAGPGFTVSSWG